MTGDWERKSETLWVYRRHGHALIYGYVARRPGAVAGAGRDRWDALAVAAQGADVVLGAGLALEEARRALERYVVAHGAEDEGHE